MRNDNLTFFYVPMLNAHGTPNLEEDMKSGEVILVNFYLEPQIIQWISQQRPKSVESMDEIIVNDFVDSLILELENCEKEGHKP